MGGPLVRPLPALLSTVGARSWAADVATLNYLRRLLGEMDSGYVVHPTSAKRHAIRVALDKIERREQ
jgi:hypothetical protein